MTNTWMALAMVQAFGGNMVNSAGFRRAKGSVDNLSILASDHQNLKIVRKYVLP